jgi:aryl-alcohol dehydrogenase-like predicted oxidoreductase
MTDSEYDAFLMIGLPVMAYSAQALGFFSKYFENGGKDMRPRAQAYLYKENIRRAYLVKDACSRLRCTPEALCIACITCNAIDGYAVIANSNIKQMEQSLTAADLVIEREVFEKILKRN